MQIYPDNTRARFSNILPKSFRCIGENGSGLYVSLESLIIENSIVQYDVDDSTPDILWVMKESSREFFLRRSRFDNVKTLLLTIKREIREAEKFFRGRYPYLNEDYTPMKITNHNGRFIILPNINMDIYFSKKFLSFLGFSEYFLDDYTIHETFESSSILKPRYKNLKMLRFKNHEPINPSYRADRKFSLHYFIPSLIKVVCKNIAQNMTGSGYDFVLENIPLRTRAKILHFCPNIKKLYKISTDELKSITFELRDEYNELIKFQAGVPTICKLRIVEMSDKNFFYIRVSNSDSNHIFEQNTCSNFHVKLPKEISLSSEWKVGLTNIYIPKNIYNIYDPINIIKLDIFEHPDSNEPESQIEAVIKPGCYFSAHLLKNAFNKAMKISPLRIQLDEKSNRFFVAGYNKKNIKTCRMHVRIHKKLIGMLGYDENQLIMNSSSYISLSFRYYKDVGSYNVMVCNELLEVNSEGSTKNDYLFSFPPRINFSISPWIFIYCSIVEHSVTGNTAVPLLKIVPLNFKDFTIGHVIEFDSIEFVSLSHHTFYSIKFEIRNHDGEYLSCGEDNLMITLMFKK